jgi:hypothetical protein
LKLKESPKQAKDISFLYYFNNIFENMNLNLIEIAKDYLEKILNEVNGIKCLVLD